MKFVRIATGLFLIFAYMTPLAGQHSAARQWNEVLLEAIRKDFARPTIHARNLFHTSILMYDSWAVFDSTAQTYFLGKSHRGFNVPFSGVQQPDDVRAAREETMSYAAYRLMYHRFLGSPNLAETWALLDSMMNVLGYDPTFTSTDYSSTGSPAALGNYLASMMIAFGLQDGSSELNDYESEYYEPVNGPLSPPLPGNPNINDPNRWQPLSLDIFIDQSGNPRPFNTPPFLTPEWGRVVPFALTENDLTIRLKGEVEYWLFHDPGDPPYIDPVNGGDLTDEYKANFEMVHIWSSHLDPATGVMVDISPASFGNNDITDFPLSTSGLLEFYDFYEGGDFGPGHEVNPHTGEPYAPQVVPLGDYARVLAEFWADGPDSETPPGHWFSIMNYVSDHPELQKQFRGEGEELDDLEWDVKIYLTLGGAVHDAGIAAWGAKGWYDYIRPISALRYMADKGQSTDPGLPSYDPAGINLHPGYIELVEEGDPLAGENNENVGKIKFYGWRGPDYIDDPETDVAGVGWILAENWWPYQKPSFVTPPFAGYVSGHSTFSRAAAEVLTMFTGDPFFPGGMGEFHAPKDEFLVFENGPSVDMTLQWATYRDASDQTSLSRIWGGIHPPVDDIPGRIMGAVIGQDAFEYAACFFDRPEELFDTVELACASSEFEWLLEDTDVTRWSWSYDGSALVSGPSTGEADGDLLISDMLMNTSDSEQELVYEITGHNGNCQVLTQRIAVRIAAERPPLAACDIEVEGNAVSITNNSIGATDFNWDFGDGNTDTTANPVHVYEIPGEYLITLIASNECGVDTTAISVELGTTSTSEIPGPELIALSPNPNSGRFVLLPTELEGLADMTIYNVMGSPVYSRLIDLSQPAHVDLRAVPAGIYYAVIESDSLREVLQVAVQ